jgi:hypothetical protein
MYINNSILLRKGGIVQDDWTWSLQEVEGCIITKGIYM